MENRHHIIKQYVVPRWRLFLGSVLSLMLYPFLVYAFYTISSGVWELLSGMDVEPPQISFMSSYGREAQNGYWIFVWSSMLGVLVLSALLPSKLGASIGKYALGIRYLTVNGDNVRLRHTLARAGINIVFFLIIALPGPIIGFTLSIYEKMNRSSIYDQPASYVDYLSLAALFTGMIVVLILTLRRDASGRVLSYSRSGIVPVMKSQVESYKNAVKSAQAGF